MKKEIFSLAEIGKKVARLANNRNLDAKDVKVKAKSLNENKQLAPAVVVDALRAVGEGLKVVDFVTNKAIDQSELVNYVVLIEGNHRYQAHLNLLDAKAKAQQSVEEARNELEKAKTKGKEKAQIKLTKAEATLSQCTYNGVFWVIYPLYDDVPITTMLPEMNIVTNPWKGNDFGKCLALTMGDNAPEGSIAISMLISDGCKLTTASLWVAFTKEITKSALSKCMSGKETASALTNGANIKRGLNLYNAAKAVGFTGEYLGKRYFIEWLKSKVIEDNGAVSEDKVAKMLDFIKNLPKDVVDDALEQKGAISNTSKLDMLWESANK